MLGSSNNNLSNTVKISPASIKNAIIARGNANRFFDLDVTLSDGTVAYLNIDKDTARVTTCKDGTWTDLYTLASKSDLPKYDIKTFTVDVTTQNANSNGKYYTEKKLSTESWYSSAKAIVPLFARKSGSNYICMAEIEYETLRVQADIAISGVTVGILAVS